MLRSSCPRSDRFWTTTTPSACRNHTHLYLGPADHDHVHPFEVPGHYHYYTDEAPPDGIVYLASYDGSSPVMIDATVHAIQQSPPFVGLDDAVHYGVSADHPGFPKTRSSQFRRDLLAPSSLPAHRH